MKTRRMTFMEALALLQSLDEEESNGGAGSESDVSWCLEEGSSSSESDSKSISEMPPIKKRRLETLNSTFTDIPSANFQGMRPPGGLLITMSIIRLLFAIMHNTVM